MRHKRAWHNSARLGRLATVLAQFFAAAIMATAVATAVATSAAAGTSSAPASTEHANAPHSNTSEHKVSCAGRNYHYLLYQQATKDSPPEMRWPALLLLHGANGEPEPMLEAWKKLASQRGIILLAPEIPSERWFEPLAPAVFRCETEDAEKFAPIDRARVSVFGYSMGGYLAYDAAMYQSEFFAAVVVLSMGIAKYYDGIVAHATRKMPLAIYTGDSDPLVDVRNVRRTVEMLKQAGFSVHYVELKGHDHEYLSASDKINADAWTFLSDKKLN